jgi:hypothetical protein
VETDDTTLKMILKIPKDLKPRSAAVKKAAGHPLSIQQENFCRSIAAGVSQYKSVLEAFPAALKWPRSACDVKGSQLMSQLKIKQRIEDLRAPAERKITQTIEDHVAKLQEMRDISIGKNQMGAAMTAEIASGKVRGFYVERVQVEVGSFPSLAAARKAMALEAINIEIARREALPPPDIEDVEIKE